MTSNREGLNYRNLRGKQQEHKAWTANIRGTSGRRGSLCWRGSLYRRESLCRKENLCRRESLRKRMSFAAKVLETSKSRYLQIVQESEEAKEGKGQLH